MRHHQRNTLCTDRKVGRLTLYHLSQYGVPFPLPPIAPDAPLLTRTLSRLPEIAAAAVAAAQAATPEAGSAGGHFEAEIAATTVTSGRLFLQGLTEQRPFTRADLPEFIAQVTRVAEDRIPLPVLAAGFYSGMNVFWSGFADAATPEDTSDLTALGAHFMAYLQLLAIVCAEVYIEAQQDVFGAERDTRRSLCSAFLRGEPVDDLAARAGVRVDAAYDVLAIDAASELAYADPLVGRRQMRWVQEVLDDACGATVLNSFDGGTGIALLPVHAGTSCDRDARAETIVRSLAQRFQVDVFLAEEPSTAVGALPDVARRCADVTDLVRRLGRPSGVYRIEDVLLEYQITRPGPVRNLLAERLSPLDGQPHLMDALTAHIRHGADRKSAACRLHIHPNTFTYRLRRIAELTGIDPTQPDGSRLLAAAITVRQVIGADGKG